MGSTQHLQTDVRSDEIIPPDRSDQSTLQPASATDRAVKPSSLPQLNFRVEPFEFGSGIVGGELPVDAGLA